MKTGLGLVGASLAFLLFSTTAVAQAADVEAAKKIIRGVLLDPGSATFTVVSQTSAVTKTGEKTNVVCGSYNAKNRFGGYVGSRKFVYVRSERAVYTTDIARFSHDGTSVTADDLADDAASKARIGRFDADEMDRTQQAVDQLSDEVLYWFRQC